MIASLTEIETEQDGTNNLLRQLFEHLANLFDAIGTILFNKGLPRKHQVSTLFPDKQRQKAKKQNIFTLPDGTNVLIEE